MFDIHIGDIVLTEEQQHVTNNIIINMQGLHILTGIPWSVKTFFLKNIAQCFHIHNTIVTLSIIMGAIALILSRSASAVHTVLCIPTHDYLFVLPDQALFWLN